MSLLNKLVEVEPGTAIIYWTGELAVTCEAERIAKVRLPIEERATLPTPAMNAREEAWFAYEKGRAFLVQRRLGDHCCEYLAIRRKDVEPQV